MKQLTYYQATAYMHFIMRQMLAYGRVTYRGMSMRERTASGLKIAGFFLGLTMMLRGHPPANAQEEIFRNDVPCATTKDCVQDQGLRYSTNEIQEIKKKQKDDEDAIELLKQENSSNEAYIKGIGFCVTLFTGGGFVLSIKRKKDAS